MTTETTTPEAVSAEIRSALAERRRAEETANSLTITPPAECPQDLAGQIRFHNDAVGKHAERVRTIEKDLASLPEHAIDLPAGKMVDEADRLRSTAYSLAQERVRLFRDRRPILKGIADVLVRKIEVARTDLQKARQKARAGLVKAGYVPLAARRSGAGTFPDAEERQLNREVDQTPAVVAAKAVHDRLTADLAATKRLIHAVDADAALATGGLLAAWQNLIGRLV